MSIVFPDCCVPRLVNSYSTNQKKVDKLVYEMYNLNEDDIKEVENWYHRKYSKLAKVIEEKIKRGKM